MNIQWRQLKSTSLFKLYVDKEYRKEELSLALRSQRDEIMSDDIRVTYF